LPRYSWNIAKVGIKHQSITFITVGIKYLVVFYCLNRCGIWLDKGDSLLWEWLYKRDSLLWEWLYKRDSLLLEWLYKRDSLLWEWLYKRDQILNCYKSEATPLIRKLLLPRYSWNIAKVGIKYQSITFITVGVVL
jgi:hypothetical protein